MFSIGIAGVRRLTQTTVRILCYTIEQAFIKGVFTVKETTIRLFKLEHFNLKLLQQVR